MSARVTPLGQIPFRIRERQAGATNTEVSYMRHRIGIVLAVIMAGALFFPGAWGYLRLLRLPGPADQLSNLPAGGGSLLSNHQVLLALAAVAGTALLAGILIVVPRVSPLATGLPGLLLLGWTALYLVNVRQGVDLIPLRADPFGAGFEAMLFSGILAALGLAMILPMFVPSRWRDRPRAGTRTWWTGRPPALLARRCGPSRWPCARPTAPRYRARTGSPRTSRPARAARS